jgi:putative endonuclease
MTSSSKRGQSGEQRATEFLQENGYNILQKNFRLSVGEADIIGEKDRVLHFLEVKSWAVVPFEGIEQSVSRRKRERIQLCAAEFLRRYAEFDGYGVVFDLIFLDRREDTITHIENAWTSSDPS